jgi:hypothetical protein
MLGGWLYWLFLLAAYFGYAGWLFLLCCKSGYAGLLYMQAMKSGYPGNDCFQLYRLVWIAFHDG